jgi:hypothetical protein
MKTISISDKTADFIAKLSKTIETQDNRSTATPIYFTVRKFVDVIAADGCGDKNAYFDRFDAENYTEESAKDRAKDLEMDFEDYVEKRCTSYETKEEEQYEGFFLTLDGYNEHVRLNGHNISCNRFDSYVDHIYRNPEIESVIEAIKEIGISLNERMRLGEVPVKSDKCIECDVWKSSFNFTFCPFCGRKYV